MLSKLPHREQLILKYTYDLDGYPELSGDDIAELLKVTKERIRQLRIKAIARLKKEI